MALEILEHKEPTCNCGHLASRHYSEVETVHFSGLFNPELAGRVETYVWVECRGDEDPQGEPCNSIEHSWN